VAAVATKCAILNIKTGVLSTGLDGVNQYLAGFGGNSYFIHIRCPDEVRAQYEKDEYSGDSLTQAADHKLFLQGLLYSALSNMK